MAKQYVVVAVAFVVLILLAIGVYFYFGDFFKSPQEVCALQGKIYDPVRDICISAGGIGDSCAPLLSNGLCQLGLECNLDALAPLNGFFTCQGDLQFPVQGGF